MAEVVGAGKTGRWTESALKVLRERYLARDGEQVTETPEEMCWRVALAIAKAERNWGKGEEEIRAVAGEFRDLMQDMLFLPNSPTLMNAGKDNGLQYSACYVLPVEDSLEGIFESIKRAALIHKSGGGTGFAFSRLRSKDSTVQSTGGKASGPVSFMRVFNAATEAVKQGGTRRGANMGILRVDHPDILEFIDCKLDGGITNFNISVAITDSFMKALDEDGEYDLVDPGNNSVVRRLRAGEVFDRVVQAAWRTGDPGLVFIDRVNASSANPTPRIGEIEATNPCGEQPLLPNEACNLGSLNLTKFVRAGKAKSNGKGPIDWKEMERVIRLAVRFLDDVIEVNPYPLADIDRMVKSNRRIGLGVMGWADMLIQLGIPYDSEEALEMADQVMGFIEKIGHEESARLAEERGTFANWSGSIYKDGLPLRNATVTTIAPTGTISIIAGSTSGIEPLFAIAFRHIVGDRHLNFVNPHFERVAKERGFYSEELMEKVVRQGTLHGLEEIPEDVRRVFVTAHEVAPEWHVRMQATFQRHVDNGVSKTVNLPNAATVEGVAAVYRQAYQVGCLGITVFRDGCKGTQVLHVGSAEKDGQSKATGEAEKVPVPSASLKVKPRPRIVHGVTYRAETPLGTAFVTVNRNGNDEPFEVFLNVGKAGSDTAAVSEALGRLISMTLRLPSALSPTERLKAIVGQMSGIGGGRQLGFGRSRVRSLPDAVAQVLAEHLGESSTESAITVELSTPLLVGEESGKVGDLCPECGHATLVYEEGCQKCYSCGYSEC